MEVEIRGKKYQIEIKSIFFTPTTIGLDFLDSSVFFIDYKDDDEDYAMMLMMAYESKEKDFFIDFRGPPPSTKISHISAQHAFILAYAYEALRFVKALDGQRHPCHA